MPGPTPSLSCLCLLPNCTIYQFRECRRLFHFNSQHQAQGLQAAVAILQSVPRHSFIPVKPAPPNSCFCGAWIVVSLLADCQNPHPIQLLPLRPLLPLAVDTPGVPTSWVNPGVTPNQLTLTSPVAGTSLCSTQVLAQNI